MRSNALSFFLLIAMMGEAFADWPMFRGPNAHGIAEGELPIEWSREKNMRWVAEIRGVGSSSPIISGDAVFVTSYTGASDEIERHLTRFDLQTGEKIWTRSVGGSGKEDALDGWLTDHGYASNTPVTDGEKVYAFFSKAGVFAYSFDGELQWKAEAGSMSSSKMWGSGSSPIIFEDLLIVPAGEESREIFALDLATGARVWTYRDEALENTYGTPIIVDVDEERTDLVFAAKEKWLGLDPRSGDLRWFARYNIPSNMSMTTHHSGDFLSIAGGHPRNARVAIRVGGEGDRSDELLFDTIKPTGDITTPVEVDGVIYWIPDNGVAFATLPGEAEGLWQERIENIGGKGARGKPFYGSPIVAGGLIYIASRSNGTFVIEPSREGLKIIARNPIDGDRTFFNATPAVSDGILLLRSQTHLYAISELGEGVDSE